ncbi:MAG: helix-turn-helix domain-containing protein [Alphaproteobacteria bacterium]|nr:helix-turn-helix domain-containing protein [Alphaproteobacteria bacterium]
MARNATRTRARILGAAYRLFFQEGFSRVSVDAIAQAAEVTKRTLYNHFDSKDTLVAAVLDHQRAYALAQIQSWRPIAAATPAEFLVALFEALERWASRPRWLGSGFTRLTMELADLPGHPARAAAHRHKAEVEAWLAEELARLSAPNPTELARQAMLLSEGCMALMLIHGSTAYAAAAAAAARKLADGSDS